MEQDSLLTSTPVSKAATAAGTTPTRQHRYTSTISYGSTDQDGSDLRHHSPSFSGRPGVPIRDSDAEQDHTRTSLCCGVLQDSSHSSVNSSQVSGYASCIRCRSKSNPNVTILVVFLAVMIDVMLMTVIDPILPDLMMEIDLEPDRMVSNAFISRPVQLDNITIDGNTTSRHSVQIAMLVALKPGLEMVFNVVVGFVVDRIGHQIPMLSGCCFNLVATLSFAYLRNYYLLVLARGFQALGSSLSVVGGLALLAASFPDDKTRTVAASKAFAGISVGVAGGFAMGSILYQFCGRESPFLIIAGLNVMDGVMRILLISPSHKETAKVGLKYALRLIRDPQILVALLINFMQHVCLGIFLGTVPAWMLYTLHSEQWMVGTILAIAAVIHVTSQFVAGRLSHTLGQWRLILTGQLIIAIAMAAYPFCTTPWEVLIPECISRIGQGILMACINPILCHIVDIRHDSHYGVINGLYTGSYNLALFIGPNVGGGLIKYMPFGWIYWGFGSFMAIFSFMALFLRNIDSPVRESTSSSDTEEESDAFLAPVRRKDGISESYLPHRSNNDKAAAIKT